MLELAQDTECKLTTPLPWRWNGLTYTDYGQALPLRTFGFFETTLDTVYDVLILLEDISSDTDDVF